MNTLLLVCTCMVVVAWGALLPSVIPGTFGINIHWTSPRPREMQMLADCGWGFVRMDFDWAAIETVKGQYDFSQYDILSSNLTAHGMRALFILDYSNPLYDNGLSPYDDEGRTAFANWAAASVTHFKGKGYLWEMYNEPNIGFWKPTPNVTQYVELALAVGKAIKAVQPTELYIGAAVSTFDWNFITGALEGGVLDYFDCFSLHPYRQDAPETATPDFQQLRALIDKYAPKGKFVPIISSEWGYSTLYAHENLENQGKLLPRMLMNNLANQVDVSIYYDWHDDCTDPTDDECHFGTVFYEYLTNQTNPYTPKPNYISAQTLMSLLKGYTFSKQIPQSSANDYVFAFEQASKTAYAAWTLDANHTISFPANSGCFTRTTYLGETLAQLCSSGGVLKVDVSDGVSYLTPA